MSNVNLSQQLANFHAALIKYEMHANDKEPASDGWTLRNSVLYLPLSTRLFNCTWLLGCIPFYLEQIDHWQSASQNINRLCFGKNAALRTEFDNLYRSLFDNAEKHIAIVESLSKKARGLTRGELIKDAGLPTGGSVTKILKELEESNFIQKIQQ